MKSERVVVVTGASAGVGRAAAKAFAGRGDRVALLARGEEGLAAAAAEVEPSRRRGAGDLRPTSPIPTRSSGGRASRARARPDRRLGQRRDGHGLRALRGDRAGGVPPRRPR